ncbi:MAG TPA: TorF family putative porin, partial [Pontiella sp.]
MNKIITTAVVAGLMVSTGWSDECNVPETEVSVSADFASAYVWRGLTVNEDAVFQPGVEVSGLGLADHCGALSVGVWGNYDIGDNDGASSSSEFSEVDWYASYGLPSLIDGVDFSLGYTEYTYPGINGGSDKELSAGLGYSIADISIGATAYQFVGGELPIRAYYQLSAGYDLEIDEDLMVSLGASVAYTDYEGMGGLVEDGLSDGSLSASLDYTVCDNWSVGASVTYI